MANRPLRPYLWAAEALAEDIGDADVYVPSNPSYPEQKPNQYTSGWSVTNKTVVKQPHQWVNSWYQSVDYTLMMQRSGELGWDAKVTFAKGAVVLHSGKRYVAQSSNINKRPDINATIWYESYFGLKSAAEVLSAFDQIDAAYSLHEKDAKNPHDTIWSNFYGGIGSSIAQIDAQVKTEADSIENHKRDKSNSHVLTCAQVKVLPATGGTFTGAVGMLRMLRKNGESVRRAGNYFELANNGNTLGLSTKVVKDGQDVVTFENYLTVKARNNIKFSVPTPAIHLPLTCDINAYAASGTKIEYLSTGTVEFTNKSGGVETAAVNEPGFGVDGLELRTGKGQKLNITGAYKGTTGTVSGLLDGVLVVGDILLNKDNLLEYFPVGTAIKDIRLWNQPLTAQQKSALGATA